MQEAHGDPTRINGKHQGNPSHLRVRGDHTLRTELPKVPWNPRAHTQTRRENVPQFVQDGPGDYSSALVSRRNELIAKDF